MILWTAERFKEDEADQRRCAKERENALDTAGKLVRQQAMQRQNSCLGETVFFDTEENESEDVDAISIAENYPRPSEPHGGHPNIRTPLSTGARLSRDSRDCTQGHVPEDDDAEFCSSAKRSSGARVALEARRLDFEQRKWEGESEISSKRAKLDEDRYEREADIQKERLALVKGALTWKLRSAFKL
jgi:hypothetical protein